MADAAKLDAHLDLKPRQTPRSSFDLSDYPGEVGVPFFKSSSRRGPGGDTWIVSLFVFLHIVAFFATMAVNDCGRNSHGHCALKELRRLSFQPLSENPLLGPSASTLDAVGALRRTWLAEHQTWRLFTSPLLHAGLFHLLINLICVVYVGIRLEQDIGPLRCGIIYTFSASVGSMVGAVFVPDSPQVSSSGALFGLLGAMLSGLLRNWGFYTNKLAALASIFSIFTVNFTLGLLPYIDNFSSIGGFISGFLLGLVLLKSLNHREWGHNKCGLFDFGGKSSLQWRQKLDKPVLRIVALLLFVVVLSGSLIAILWGINLNQYCSWCRLLNCIPSKGWNCQDTTSFCQILQSIEGNAQSTLTCMANGKFRVFPFTDISPARIADLCTLICS